MPPPSPADRTVSVHVARALVLFAGASGHSPEALEQRLGLPRGSLSAEALSDAGGRVPARVVLRLWESLPSLCGDEVSFGLRLAALAARASPSVSGWLILSSESLAEGLGLAVRYQRLMHDEARGELSFGPEGARYVHRVGDEVFRAPPAAIEFGFASLVHLARRATGEAVMPSRVMLRHPRPQGDLPLHREVFGEVRFSSATDELWFDRASLSLPHRSADASLRELVESHARVLLEKVPAGNTHASRVRRLVAERLRGRPVELGEIAQASGLSPRALQRALRDEGTSFAEIVEQVRRELAPRYLADPSFDVADAALLLGYSEQSAFHRAFVRWTGETPGAYRRAALAKAAAQPAAPEAAPSGEVEPPSPER